MPKIKRTPIVTIASGDTIEIAQDSLQWGGIAFPRGTRGKANGWPYSIGGDASKTFLPSWARKVSNG